MTWWILLMLLVYTCACVFLIFVILIQSGKGGGLSSLAGASQGMSEMLGSTSSERTLNRMTTYAAITFMVLAILISLGGASVARQRAISLPADLNAPLSGPISTQGQPPVSPVPATGATTVPPTGTPAARGSRPIIVGTIVVTPTPVQSTATPGAAAPATAPVATPAR